MVWTSGWFGGLLGIQTMLSMVSQIHSSDIHGILVLCLMPLICFNGFSNLWNTWIIKSLYYAKYPAPGTYCYN